MKYNKKRRQIITLVMPVKILPVSKDESQRTDESFKTQSTILHEMFKPSVSVASSH